MNIHHPARAGLKLDKKSIKFAPIIKGVGEHSPSWSDMMAMQ